MVMISRIYIVNNVVDDSTTFFEVGGSQGGFGGLL